MTENPGLDALNKRCERSITQMTDADALAYIAELIRIPRATPEHCYRKPLWTGIVVR